MCTQIANAVDHFSQLLILRAECRTGAVFHKNRRTVVLNLPFLLLKHKKPCKEQKVHWGWKAVKHHLLISYKRVYFVIQPIPAVKPLTGSLISNNWFGHI